MIASLGRLPATNARWNFCSSRVHWPTNGDHNMPGRMVRRNTAKDSRATGGIRPGDHLQQVIH
jgi:hypothetical protein